MKRHLITTSDEKTWKLDKPVIFLGEWCKSYDRKNIWEKMDAIVAEPYGLSKKKKDADYERARELEVKIFHRLCIELNKLHQTEHGERFWRIILGHWLRHFLDVIVNRVKTIEFFLENYEFNSVTTYTNLNSPPCPLDINEAIWYFNDSKWNNILYTKILLFLGITNDKIEFIEDSLDDTNVLRLLSKPRLKKRLLKYCWEKIGQTFNLLSRDDDAFIINSYLPKLEQIKLELALKQIPQFRVSYKPALSRNYDHSLRQRLSKNITNINDDKLLTIITSLIFEYIPICYIEGFSELNEISEKLSWPKTPKFIFTSANFYDDEVFKFWAAKKTESGVPYYVGQHGNYGVTKYELNPSIEEMTSDKFLTWGWSDNLKTHTPTFIFKTIGKKIKSYNPRGNLVLIELFHSLPIWTWDASAEHTLYFRNQLRFISNLELRIKNDLIVRLHIASSALNWSEIERFKDFDPSIKLDIGYNPIQELIAKSRLVVHSYDSTGILETMSQNIPTLAFWQNGFDHLRDSAKPFYQLLVNAGIVHLTPESIASKVNEIWDDVDGWWADSKVQNARREFCNRYAVTSKTPIRDLKKILNT